MKYPPIPKTVAGASGDIVVKVVEKVPAENGDRNIGLWDSEERAIYLAKSLTPRVKWMTFYHELVHAALDDAGASNVIQTEHQEMICDAIATARMRERFG